MRGGSGASGSRGAHPPSAAVSCRTALSGGCCARRPSGAACVPDRARRRQLMRALVTGATGFVGSAVARALVAAGWQVRALVRGSSDHRNLQSLPVDMVAGDLADGASLDRALSDCQALFHLAADYRLGALEPQQLYRTNVDGTRSILDAARRAAVSRVVYTSSVATIGLPEHVSPATEETPVALADMIGHYKRSQYLAEQLACSAPQTGTSV